jgi:glycosyltransferase involved in cell wall biosynthesis
VRILLIFTFDVSLKNWEESGFLSREISYYQEMKNNIDVNITFLTFGGLEDKFLEQELADINIIPVYEKFKYSNSKVLRVIKSIFIPIYFREEFSKADVIKTNQLLGSWVGIIGKLIFRNKLIVRTGYDLFKFKLKQSRNPFTIMLSYLLTMVSLNFSDIYITTSKNDYKYLNKYYIFKKQKLKLLPNWIQSKKYIPFQERYKNKILMVGRLEKQKNFERIITDLENSRIEIDLYGEGSQKKYLLELAKNNNVKLNLKGKIDNKELLKVYANYKLFVSTSLYEGNPKTVLEAMSMGCLILALKNNAIEELIENNKNGIIFDDDFSELKSLIETILEDSKNFESIAKKGYEKILESNSKEVVLKKEINFLNNF